jgi:chloramphenicol 3-O-phosphotransferase
VKAILGPASDEALYARLSHALNARRARRLWHWRGHGGSQEISRAWYLIGASLLRVHAETYFDLAITGSRSVVEELAREVQSRSSEITAPAT